MPCGSFQKPLLAFLKKTNFSGYFTPKNSGFGADWCTIRHTKYANGKPPAFLARGHVKHIKVKGKKGKKSKKETYDLIVNIDLVSLKINV